MEQKANYLPRSTNIKKNKSCAIKEMTTRRMINDEINYWADKIIHVMIVWNPNHVKLNCDKGLFNLRIVEKNLIQCEKAFLCSSSSLLLAPSHSKRYRKFCNEIKTTCNRIKWGWRKKKQFRVVMWCINAKVSKIVTQLCKQKNSSKAHFSKGEKFRVKSSCGLFIKYWRHFVDFPSRASSFKCFTISMFH